MSRRPWFDFLGDLPQDVLIEEALEVVQEVHDLLISLQLVAAENNNKPDITAPQITLRTSFQQPTLHSWPHTK